MTMRYLRKRSRHRLDSRVTRIVGTIATVSQASLMHAAWPNGVRGSLPPRIETPSTPEYEHPTLGISVAATGDETDRLRPASACRQNAQGDLFANAVREPRGIEIAT